MSTIVNERIDKDTYLIQNAGDGRTSCLVRDNGRWYLTLTDTGRNVYINTDDPDTDLGPFGAGDYVQSFGLHCEDTRGKAAALRFLTQRAV